MFIVRLIRAYRDTPTGKQLAYNLDPDDETDQQNRWIAEKKRQARLQSDSKLMEQHEKNRARWRKISTYNCSTSIYASTPTLFSPFQPNIVKKGPELDDDVPRVLRELKAEREAERAGIDANEIAANQTRKKKGGNKSQKEKPRPVAASGRNKRVAKESKKRKHDEISSSTSSANISSNTRNARKRRS